MAKDAQERAVKRTEFKKGKRDRIRVDKVPDKLLYLARLMYSTKCPHCPGKIMNSRHLKTHGGHTTIQNITKRLQNEKSERSARNDINKMVKLIQDLKTGKKRKEETDEMASMRGSQDIQHNVQQRRRSSEC